MKKILIANDNEDICKTLENALSEKGHDIHFVRNGKEVIKRVYNISPDMIILGSKLPGIDLYQFCESIKKDRFYKNTPIMLLCCESKEEKTISDDLGVSEVLYSPIDMELFLQKVEKILSSPV